MATGLSLNLKLFTAPTTSPFSTRYTPSRVSPVSSSVCGSTSRMYQRQVSSRPRPVLAIMSSRDARPGPSGPPGPSGRGHNPIDRPKWKREFGRRRRVLPGTTAGGFRDWYVYIHWFRWKRHRKLQGCSQHTSTAYLDQPGRTGIHHSIAGCDGNVEWRGFKLRSPGKRGGGERKSTRLN